MLSYLGDFLFSPQRARTPVKALSGGERARLLLELIAALLNNDVVPFAPGEGSVGYLAVEGHLALVLLGEGKARVNGGEWVDGATALKQVGLQPTDLQCKEGLAMLNGTTSVTAIAILALYNAMQTASLADVAAALSMEALKGTIRAFDPLEAMRTPYRIDILQPLYFVDRKSVV